MGMHEIDDFELRNGICLNTNDRRLETFLNFDHMVLVPSYSCLNLKILQVWHRSNEEF